jgi:hypothetical protein
MISILAIQYKKSTSKWQTFKISIPAASSGALRNFAPYGYRFACIFHPGSVRRNLWFRPFIAATSCSVFWHGIKNRITTPAEIARNVHAPPTLSEVLAETARELTVCALQAITSLTKVKLSCVAAQHTIKRNTSRSTDTIRRNNGVRSNVC